MFTPIYDLVRYTRLFKEYLGNRIYIIFLLGLFAAISEGIGILMLLPLLETLESNPSKEQLDSISLIIFNALEYLGIQPTIISIIILIVCLLLINPLCHRCQEILILALSKNQFFFYQLIFFLILNFY